MDDLLEALKSRLRNPLLGYFLLSSIGINWKSIFYLIAAKETALSRIEFADSHTSLLTVVALPLAISIAILVANPWLGWLIAKLTSRPHAWRDLDQINARHELALAKKRLEDLQTQRVASKEDELIDRATRDQRVEAIDNEQLRAELKSALEQVRAARDATADQTWDGGALATEQHKKLNDIAAEYRERAYSGNVTVEEKNHLIERAKELETEAYGVLVRSIKKGGVS